MSGRVALVTGAAHGIGRAIAMAVAAEGATVALADRDGPEARDVAASLRASKVESLAIEVDVGDRTSVDAMVATTIDAFSRVDVLVNNAGIVSAASIVDLTDAEWDAMLRIDLTGVFLCTRAVIPHMVSRKWGRIINIGSQVALKGAEQLAHYCAAKAGVHGFTRAIARDLAPHGITANVIAPGPVDTEPVRRLPEAWRANKLAELPIGRFATPEEIAPTAVLLASDGGAYYTGSTLNVSGGDVMQ